MHSSYIFLLQVLETNEENRLVLENTSLWVRNIEVLYFYVDGMPV